MNPWGKGRVALVVVGCLWIVWSSIAQEAVDDISSEKQQIITRTVKVGNYTIKPEDKLTLQILEKRQDPVVPIITPVLLHVSPSGEVDVPMIGRTGVAGKTLSQAAKDIKLLVERLLFYEVTVKLSVEEVRLSSVTINPDVVVGQVRDQSSVKQDPSPYPASVSPKTIQIKRSFTPRTWVEEPMHLWGGFSDVPIGESKDAKSKYFVLLENAKKDPTGENFLKAWQEIKSMPEDQDSLAKHSKLSLILTLKRLVQGHINRRDQTSTKQSAVTDYQRDLMALDEEISKSQEYQELKWFKMPW
jgi:hypothetical protein